MRYLLLAGLLLAASAAAAQTTRTVQATELWPEAQGELALQNGDYLLLGLRGERSQADNSYTNNNRSLGFNAYRLMAGYEHFWSPAWSVGGTLRLTGGPGQLNLLVPEVLLRHRSPIFGGITFGQRLSVERLFFVNTQTAAGIEGQTWTRLRLDLEKLLPLGTEAAGLALRPRLSYEASTHLRLQKAAGDPDERTIQFTSLRGELGVRVSPSFDFTPWFAYQTSYGTSLPQYDNNGNQVRGGKYNDVYPTVGLDLRYTLLPAGGKAARQQLPTQH
ncbi:hypothetical protein [Hymenobacter cheonanensis]|uniref:hypothetical protein n=1 Tax=Hymenobacter sp. CA2-7 TaxID=3063993 RepID=UPI002714413B|nr:hypothetical protein [Hymenobacter sp. CA2-7]MDO7885633.1 hypothetical protein [Hymenobacter sp. CA2-7]